MPYARMTPLLLNIRQYAEIMGLSESFVRQQVKRGIIRHVRIETKVLIPADEPQRQIDIAMAKKEGESK